MSPNVLLLTLDQFRWDALSCAGHPLVKTPNLDKLAASGVRLANHFAQAAPCAPGRAALYTGTYQFNNRVVANGSPLDHRFDNVALMARRHGYVPSLFGYTDQAVDPSTIDDPQDPRLQTYEGILPGFDAVLDLRHNHEPWLAWLGSQGFEGEDIETVGRALNTENHRSAEYSLSAFLTDHLLEFIATQQQSWFVHASYLRPHPPYRAAGSFSTMYDPNDIALPIPRRNGIHPLADAILDHHEMKAPVDVDRLKRRQAQYFGMVSEVDHQLGRVWDVLKQNGSWDNTLIVITADHGEYLGDHGLIGKGGFYEQSYRVLGIVRDPTYPQTHGTVIQQFTENVDVLPTIAEAIGAEIPRQCDGESLAPLLSGSLPKEWRDAAHYEFDWRSSFLTNAVGTQRSESSLQKKGLAVSINDKHAYVQFGDGSWLCFDLVADPTWGAVVSDPAVVLPLAQAMSVWRATHTDRTHTSTLLGAE